MTNFFLELGQPLPKLLARAARRFEAKQFVRFHSSLVSQRMVRVAMFEHCVASTAPTIL